MGASLSILCATAASIGFIHTLAGPDHYLPFVAMARVGGWSLRRTMVITALCGVGHVLGSVALGFVGILVGWSLAGVETFEGLRGDLAAWLLLGFGLAYCIWGIRRAVVHRSHTHLHVHADGTVHAHPHAHVGHHVHVHDATHPGDGLSPAAPPARQTARLTPWILFTIFVFGPCEPLIPLLMYPAAEMNLWGAALVALIFSAATIGTMLAMVGGGYVGVAALPFARLERYSHATAGLAVTACAALMMAGW